MLRLFVTILGAAAVSATQVPQSGCSKDAPPSAVPYDTVNWPSLAGKYHVILVNTQPRWDLATDSTRLELVPNDSVARVTSIYGTWDRTGRVYNRVLGGSATQRDSSGREYKHPAEVERSTLYIGCRGCNDASPTNLRILAINADGFWGTWFDPMTGIGIPIGRDGQRLPDPRGYYCAIRVKD